MCSTLNRRPLGSTSGFQERRNSFGTRHSVRKGLIWRGSWFHACRILGQYRACPRITTPLPARTAAAAALRPCSHHTYSTNSGRMGSILMRVIHRAPASRPPRAICHRGRFSPSVKTSIQVSRQETQPCVTATLYIFASAGLRAKMPMAAAAHQFPPRRRALIHMPSRVSSAAHSARKRPVSTPAPNNTWAYPGIKKASGIWLVHGP